MVHWLAASDPSTDEGMGRGEAGNEHGVGL